MISDWLKLQIRFTFDYPGDTWNILEPSGLELSTSISIRAHHRWPHGYPPAVRLQLFQDIRFGLQLLPFRQSKAQETGHQRRALQLCCAGSQVFQWQYRHLSRVGSHGGRGRVNIICWVQQNASYPLHPLALFSPTPVVEER